MAVFRGFQALRPTKEKAAAVAALPYDVVNREEAAEIGRANPDSFLHIDRAEMDLPEDTNLYDKKVYEKARENLIRMEENGILVQDAAPCYYIYELVRKGKVQTGLVGCASIDDYLKNVVKKHELTREEKELDRIRHVDVCDANTGPIYLACEYTNTLTELLESWKKEHLAVYDFTEEDEITHRVWVIDQEAVISRIQKEMEQIPALYIADGHHRAASAVKVGFKRREEHPGYTGKEEFNYFLSVLFPDEELMIMDYNRVVRDLGDMTEEAFLSKMQELFDVQEIGNKDDVRPVKKGQFSMFLSDKWYRCTMRPESVPDDPVEGLDVSVLQNVLLAPVLGIGDPKTDKRIDFVGGIRGMKELERRCHEDCQVAFAMYPTSIQELFAVADAGRLMPPKSTWFEPKLRSGLFIHEI